MTNYRLKDLDSYCTDMKNRDKPTQKKRKRNLEVLSFSCTIVGINITLACLWGVPKSFGLSSPEVFLNCAFTFFVVAVLLGFLAMISCIKGYEYLQTSFLPIPKKLFLFSFLNTFHSKRKTNVQASESTTAEMSKKQLPNAEISDIMEKIQVTPKCLYNSSRQNYENCGFPQRSSRETSPLLRSPSGGTALHDAYNKSENTTIIPDSATFGVDGIPFLFTASIADRKRRISPIYKRNSLFRECGTSRPQGQRYFSPSPMSTKQPKAKNVLELKKRRNTILFGQLFAADSSGCVRGPVTFSCEVGRNKHKNLTSFLQGSFGNKTKGIEEFTIQSQLSGETPTSKIPSETVFSGVKNSCLEDSYNSQDMLLPISGKHKVHPKDHVSDVLLRLNEMNFLS